jgi:hypothetical protein
MIKALRSQLEDSVFGFLTFAKCYCERISFYQQLQEDRKAESDFVEVTRILALTTSKFEVSLVEFDSLFEGKSVELSVSCRFKSKPSLLPPVMRQFRSIEEAFNFLATKHPPLLCLLGGILVLAEDNAIYRIEEERGEDELYDDIADLEIDLDSLNDDLDDLDDLLDDDE